MSLYKVELTDEEKTKLLAALPGKALEEIKEEAPVEEKPAEAPAEEKKEEAKPEEKATEEAKPAEPAA